MSTANKEAIKIVNSTLGRDLVPLWDRANEIGIKVRLLPTSASLCRESWLKKDWDEFKKYSEEINNTLFMVNDLANEFEEFLNKLCPLQ